MKTGTKIGAERIKDILITDEPEPNLILMDGDTALFLPNQIRSGEGKPKVLKVLKVELKEADRG